jgi:TPR repeat protein
MYQLSHGVQQDNEAATSWYRKAAEQGLAEAQYNLGVMYANGDGVAQDYAAAHMWFNLAAASRNKTP